MNTWTVQPISTNITTDTKSNQINSILAREEEKKPPHCDSSYSVWQIQYNCSFAFCVNSVQSSQMHSFIFSASRGVKPTQVPCNQWEHSSHWMKNLPDRSVSFLPLPLNLIRFSSQWSLIVVWESVAVVSDVESAFVLSPGRIFDWDDYQWIHDGENRHVRWNRRVRAIFRGSTFGMKVVVMVAGAFRRFFMDSSVCSRSILKMIERTVALQIRVLSRKKMKDSNCWRGISRTWSPSSG